MKASIRLIEAIKKLNDKIDNIKIKEPKDGKDGLDGKDGIGIKKIEIKDNHLIITLTNNKKYDLGKVVGKDGEAGKSGRNGRDATINGENTLTIEAGNNITINQEDDVLTISSTAGDIAIPEIKISTKMTTNNGKVLRLDFGKHTQEFEDYVKENGVQIHLLKYTRSGRRSWAREKEDEETGETITVERQTNSSKKWVHPANQYEPTSPSKQCWGIRSFQRFETYDGEIDDMIANADYNISNNGIVQSEYTLTWGDFNKGYMYIKLDDIMTCIVKHFERQNEDMDIIPRDGGTERVRMIGCRVSPRRARQRQPIKYVFAIDSKKGKRYGECNTALLELFTRRMTNEETGETIQKGYDGAGFLSNIGYGVLIK